MHGRVGISEWAFRKVCGRELIHICEYSDEGVDSAMILSVVGGVGRCSISEVPWGTGVGYPSVPDCWRAARVAQNSMSFSVYRRESACAAA